MQGTERVRTRESLMTEIVHLRSIALLALLCWATANAPLIGAIVKNYRTPDVCWQIFTSSPNRYLFTLVFILPFFFACFVTWELIVDLVQKESMAPNHVLRYFAKFPVALLLGIIIASIVTLWDYTAGNFNNADLTSPYAHASLEARDLILSADSDAQPAQTGPVSKTELKTLGDNLINHNASVNDAHRFIRHISAEREALIDKTMEHLNLINVWFFAIVTWLALYLVALLALMKLSITVQNESAFWIARYMCVFSIYAIAVWTSFRSYELKEYQQFTQAVSGESIDLLLGLIMMLFGCIFLAICFGRDVQSIVTIMIGPIALVSGSYLAGNYVRGWYGSGMTVTNFFILCLAFSILITALYIVFMKSKPA